MLKGKVNTLKAEKGYGFIKTHAGIKYFFHREDFVGHWDDLVEDFAIEESVEVQFLQAPETKKGPRARQVSRLDHPNQAVVEEIPDE